MTRLAALAFIVALAACSARTASPSGTDWRVGMRSFGPIVYGATVAEASRGLAAPLRVTREYKRGCAFYGSAALPAGVSVMVVDGRVARVDVDGSADVPTAAGARVGSTEAEVHRLYPGRIRTEPHTYADGDAHYLVWTPEVPSDTTFGLVFETDGRAVVGYRAGLWGAAQAVEGCL